MAITSKTQVFLSKFNRLGSPNMRQIFNLRGKYLKKRSQVFDVSRATTDFNETKDRILVCKVISFCLKLLSQDGGTNLVIPFSFSFYSYNRTGGPR